MSQRRTTPDGNALDGLCTQRALDIVAGLVGTHQRNNQIQLRAGIDYPAGAAKNSIHFSKSPKAIDVNRRKDRTLHNQIFVAHEVPRVLFSSRGQQSTVHFQTQSDSTAGSNFRKNNSLCDCAASQQHHTSQFTRACKVFNFGHVNTADNFTLISNPIASVDFLSPDVIAPAADILPRCPAAAGAVIPWSAA
jgi:hypothetical protein